MNDIEKLFPEIYNKECVKAIKTEKSLLIKEFLADLNKCVNVKQYIKLKRKWKKRLKE